MKIYLKLVLLIVILQLKVYGQQSKSLDDFIRFANQENPYVKENANLLKISQQQKDLTSAQLRKPQINLTADYLFAPYFINDNKFISVTQNPESNAYGYNINLSNGGLYATQLNISTPLFNAGIVNTYFQQNDLQNQLLTTNLNVFINDLNKQITDQFVNAYQFQEQIRYQQKLILLLNDRKKIVSTLVEKGLFQQNDLLLLEIEINQKQLSIETGKIALYDAFNKLNNTCLINDTTIFELQKPLIKQKELLQTFNYEIKYRIDSLNILSQQSIQNLKYKPQLVLFGNTGLNATTTENIAHNVGMSAGLHLQVPIYDGKQRRITGQQNRLLLENLDFYKSQTSIQHRNNLIFLQKQILSTENTIELFNSQIKSQEDLLKILQEKVIMGQISVTDFLNAIENYSNSSLDRIQSQTNLWSLVNQFNATNW